MQLKRFYELVTAVHDGVTHPGIRCNRCGRTSYNLNDIAQRYCGWCHVFHDDPTPPPAKAQS